MKLSRAFWSFSLILAGVLTLWLLATQDGAARVGGGGSYSSGSSRSYSSGSSRSYSSGYSSSGHSSGGGGGLSLSTILIIVLVIAVLRSKGGGDETAGLVYLLGRLFMAGGGPSSMPMAGGSTGPGVARLNWRLLDKNFSRPVFLDFFSKLFTEVHKARAGNLDRWAAYLSTQAAADLRQQALQSGLSAVGDVIIGALHWRRLTKQGAFLHATIEVESNVVETRRGRQQSFYRVESWHLRRRDGVLSKPPEKVQKLGCPNCGNPGELTPQGKCPYCDQMVARSGGQFDWVVVSLTTMRQEAVAPPVGSGGVEEGTRLPTRFHPQLGARREAFMTRYPQFDWPAFLARAEHIFRALQAAWSEQKWEKARPYETDNLFGQHCYWMEAYRSQGLANRIEQIKIQKMELVDIASDAFYDSLTLRIFASMVDYTEELESGRLVSGNKDRPHSFSEYWTFIRRIGSQGGGEATSCPSCGAPLAINQAGTCEHCGAHLTSGEFDWVLSQIEQDESYQITI